MTEFEGKSLFVFGDSIMNGSGNNDFGIGEYLARDMGFELHKYCVGGARVGYDQGKSWVPEQVIKAIEDGAKADYIVFNGFTNDCNVTPPNDFPDVDLGEFPQSYAAGDVYTLTKKQADFSRCFDSVVYTFLTYFPAAKILFVRPHNMGRRTDVLQKLYGERAVEICKKWSVPVADIYHESCLNTFISQHRDLYTCDSYGWGRGDCTHPNALGYEKKYMPIIEAKIKSI
ncbi:MAG: SGNH/GDSL hydrolase family protein [Clostridia bacterium]|nr:SGNH/GDSL hydrolase family protein [Clostridia bacterium]